MENPDRYKKIKMIGQGAFSKVYLISMDNKKYALKEIQSENMDEVKRKKILEEINILRSLDDMSIIKYYDSFFDEKDNKIKIIMEYCELSLRELLNKNKKNKHFDLIEYSDQKYINYLNNNIYGICLGIKNIHKKNLILRDLKPENIFIEDNTIKIDGFGISKYLDNTDELKDSQVGAYNYMAPEILKREIFNKKADLWSLGCIIYEIISLKPCFENDNKIIDLINKMKSQNYKKLNEMIEQDRDEKFLENYQNLIDSLLKIDYKDRLDIN